jgi:hypothetical protein
MASNSSNSTEPADKGVKSETKKRSVSTENRGFNPEWEQDYLFIDMKGKPQCLVCLQVLTVMKEYNIERHYKTVHGEKYDRFKDEARTAVFNDLKKKRSAQVLTFTKSTTQQVQSVSASYTVTLAIAKAKKPLSDGTFIKECAVKMAKCFGDEKMVKNFESVSLSRQTVTRRTEDLFNENEKILHSLFNEASFFSLALDESTDVTDTSQLLIFARLINDKFEVREELLKMASLHGTTKGTDIFEAVRAAIEPFGGFGKMSSVVTDGAPAMCGRINGFIGLLHQAGIDCPAFHCIIHQESLCGKLMGMQNVMDVVMKIVNLIRAGSRALNHRNFIAYLEEIDAEYGDLLLHTDIRWMSRGKCLQRFFALRQEIQTFLRERVTSDTKQYVEKLDDPEFLSQLAFLTDISQHLNVLNIQLQGRNQVVCKLVSLVAAFETKLALFKSQLEKSELAHFPACSALRAEFETNNTDDHAVGFSRFHAVVQVLIESFAARFDDFKQFREQFQLFNDPFSAVIDSHPVNLQLELCELQSDDFLRAKYNTMGPVLEFWYLLAPAQYPELRKWSMKICSMFGSTYICESTFSTMKHVKSKERNRLSDDNLNHLLRLSTSEIDIDIDMLVKNKDSLQLSH